MRKAVLVSFVVGMVCLSGWGEEPGAVGGKESLGFSTSWSPDSSHILIGTCEERRTWTLGVEYTRRLFAGKNFRLDYEGSLLPLYEETDPVLYGTIVTIGGQSIFTPQTPVRVEKVPRGPVGIVPVGSSGASAPVYAVIGRQDTYAWSLAPLGARVSAFPRSRIQPTFGVDLGFVVSARDIPVNDSDQFNYMFALGPGIQLFANAKTSWRLEYFFRHISNAHEGTQNPGVDQGVVRVTLSLHR